MNARCLHGLTFLLFLGSSSACVNMAKGPLPLHSADLDRASTGEPTGELQKDLVLDEILIFAKGDDQSLAAFQAAVQSGADFVVPILTLTKDQVLVAHPHLTLSENTLDLEKHRGRKTKKSIDGHEVEGYFIEDFTFAELNELRSQEDRIASFAEILAWREDQERHLNRRIGLAPELRSGHSLKRINKNALTALLADIEASPILKTPDRLFVQSLDTEALKQIKKQSPKIELIQLISDPPTNSKNEANSVTLNRNLISEGGLRDIREYAYGIGLAKTYLTGNGPLKEGLQDWLHMAQAKGLKIIPYLMSENPGEMITEAMGVSLREYLYFMQLGVNGILTTSPQGAALARTEYLRDEDAEN